MENQKENQEKDAFGNLTFGEVSRLLIDIIGQNVILDLMPEKEKDAYERKLQRRYKGQGVYQELATEEPESPQWYFAQFFEGDKGIEKKYGLPHLVMIIIDSFTWQLFHALTCITSFEKPKKETALYLVRKELFNLIHDLIIGKNDPKYGLFKVSKEFILTFLTDSYDKIFSKVESKYKNKETFYKEINNYCDNNRKKYPKLSKKEVTDYKQNIINWRNKRNKRNKSFNNANWFVLVPVLDFLLDKNKKDLVNRLIGLYLLKNAQRAMEEILDISEPEQNQIIFDIITMIDEKKKPEEFYNDNDFVFPEYFNLISICLACQHHLDLEKSNEIIKVINNKWDNSKKFFYFWLKARAKIFEKGETLKLKENEEEKKQIIDDYKMSYKNGIAYAGAYLSQFLLEAITINKLFNQRREGDVNDYYGYGYAIELFRQEKQELLDPIKKIKNEKLCDIFTNIYYRETARMSNNRGLEFEKMGNFEQAIQCFSEAIILNPYYVNAYSNRGNVYNKMGELYIENTLDDFKMALLLDPKHENTLFNRGLLFFKKGQYEDAITDFTNLINIKPEDSEAYFYRGNCYGYLENYDLAIKDYNKAIEINPNYAEAYNNRGVVHKLMGNDDKAQEDLRKVLEIDPNFLLKNNVAFFGPAL